VIHDGGIRRRAEESRGELRRAEESLLRDAPGKEWDARSPEDKESFNSNSINNFSFWDYAMGYLNSKQTFT
jgi:hypothetical protein